MKSKIAHYLGYNDWRLPNTDPDVSGSNQTGSEMGHLHYSELGVVDNSASNSPNIL